jgi:hypothetical protein
LPSLLLLLLLLVQGQALLQAALEGQVHRACLLHWPCPHQCQQQRLLLALACLLQ